MIDMTVLETRDLKNITERGDTLVKALDGVDLQVENGEFVAIVGTSGEREIHPCSTSWAGWTGLPGALCWWMGRTFSL